METKANPGTAALPPTAVPVQAAPTATESAADSIADGVERKLDHRHLVVAKTVGWIVTACFALPGALAVTILLVIRSVPSWVILLVASGVTLIVAVIAWIGQNWPAKEHRHASYRVDADGIEIRRGVIWRQVINVARSRVQHTDVSQGPIERHHGLGTLLIYTAGTEHAEVSLHGLDHGVALRIRDHMMSGGGDDAV